MAGSFGWEFWLGAGRGTGRDAMGDADAGRWPVRGCGGDGAIGRCGGLSVALMQRKFWWSALALFSVATVSAWGVGIYRDRNATIDLADRQLQSTALLLEQHAGRAFEAGEAVLQGSVAVAEGVDRDDPAALDALFRQIARLRGDSDQITSIWVLDEAGVTLVESWGHPPASTGTYAEREYFQAHRNGMAGLYIGPLSTGARSGEQRFTLSRGIYAEDGTFEGVVAAGVRSAYFSDLYAQAGPGEGARMVLSRLDGVRLAEWPQTEPCRATVDAMAAVVAEAGRQLQVVRDLGKYPVRISVSRPLDMVLAPWRLRALVTGLIALVALAAFGVLTALGLRTTGRERRSRLDLMAAKAHLEERVLERTEALQIAHTRLQSLLTTAGAGTFIWQMPNGKIRSDAGIAMLFGLDAGVDSREADYLARVHPDDREAVMAKMAALQTGETRYEDEYRVVLPDGTIRWCLARGTVDANRVFSGAVFDVTELKRAEAVAAENERRLQLVADAAPALISHVGKDGRYRFVNRAYEEWFGLPRAEIVGQHVGDVLGDAALRTVGPMMERVAAGEIVRFDAVIPYREGAHRHVEAEYIPNITAGGKVDGFFGFVVDVTRRKRDEAALLEASRRTQALAAERTAILGQLTEGVIVTDDTGRITFVNEAAARIHGVNAVDVSPAEFSKVYNLFTLEGEPYPAEALPLARAVVRKETVIDEHWLIRRPDGKDVVAIGSARPVYTDDGRFMGGVLTLRDDTARRAALDELARSERRLNAVLDNTRMAVFMMDGRQHCVYMNAAAEALTGYRFEETTGRPLHEVIHHSRPDGSRFALEDCAIDRAYPDNRQTAGEEIFVHKDGHFYPVAYTASPIRNAEAQSIGTIIEARDIRAEKENAERLQMLIGELNHRVKNTLATVQSIVSQALRGEDVPVRVREAIETRVMALSRSHDLLTRQAWGSADLTDVLREALRPFAIDGDRSGRFVLAGPSVRMRPKAALSLAMAFHELATNAVKYGALSNDAGRVVIGWHVADGRLRLSWEERDGPPVTLPTQKGFGSRLIERGLAHELGGEAALEFRPEGLRWGIDVPLTGIFGEEGE